MKSNPKQNKIDFSSSHVDISIRLGRELRSLRKSHGLSQKEIASTLGISYQQVQKYEAGQNRISLENLCTIASLFGLPLDYFKTALNRPDHFSEVHSHVNLLSNMVSKISSMSDKRVREKIIKVVDILCE
jgi:transcriptional regulator with XRE-family HTH domain